MYWPSENDTIHETYDRDGFVIIKQLFDLTQVDELRTNLQRYIDDVVPRVPPMDAFFENANEKQQIRMLPRMDKHDAYFKDLLFSGSLPRIAESLSGHQVVAHDVAYFNKLPIIGDVTPPHQDGFYFHLAPCAALTLWLALDEVDEENGCIRYVCGSHRREMRNHQRTQVLGFSQGIVDYGTEEDFDKEVSAVASPGDLIVHHAMTIHRADANRSTRPRRALGFVYFSAAAAVDRAQSVEYQKQLASEWKAKGKI